MSKQEIWELFYGADTAIRGRNILAVLVAALIIGFVIFITYRVTHLSTAYSAKINATNVAITLITAVIMLMISSNIVISLGMVGALSIIRFRTAIKDRGYCIYFLGSGGRAGHRLTKFQAVFYRRSFHWNGADSPKLSYHLTS